MPILLPSHTDGPDFCFNQSVEHYHVDQRFTERLSSLPALGKPNEAIVQLRNLKCFRENSVESTIIAWPFTIVKMHEVFANHTLKNNICPHKGLKITNSCGTCPGHGLIWNLENKSLKYKLPFYLKIKKTEDTGIIQNSKCIITITKAVTLEIGEGLLLVDGNGEVYPNSELPLKNSYNLSIGDTLTLVDQNCSKIYNEQVLY